MSDQQPHDQHHTKHEAYRPMKNTSPVPSTNTHASLFALSLLAAAAGAAFSTRQILLHVMPGDAGYGSALFGYHYYTWALIGFAAAIVLLAAILVFDRQFEDDGAAQPVAASDFARIAVWLVIGLTALNVGSTLLECGFGACADNPVAYELLKHGT